MTSEATPGPTTSRTSPGHPALAGRARRSHGLVAALAALVLALALALGTALPSPSGPAAAAEPSTSPLTGTTPPSTAQPTGAPDDFDLFWEALRIVRDNYVDGEALTDQNLTRGAIRGMVEALGDTGHTVYLTPEEVQAEIDALDGRVIGIGVSVDTRGGAPVIIAVFPGSPAADAGVRAGDIIESVDGRRVDRLGVSELIDRVRGEPGTTVILGIQRADGSHEDVPIERAEVTIPPVAWAMVPGTTIADIGINQFSDGAGRETRRALRRALADGATAIVHDLRGNPGGLVHEAIGVAGLFLPQGGTVYQEQDRAGRREDVVTRDEPVAPDVPLVVLVDEGSASAAEIVAAALHDGGRARIVGERTFGTGTVLNFYPLSDGSAIRLGVLRWLTPAGIGVFETGVAPDVVVELPDTGVLLYPEALEDLGPRAFRRSDDTQLRRAVRLLTSDPTGTPRPMGPSASPEGPQGARAPSEPPAQAPPSPLEAGG
jgi:carboxyl-terminal processing protease